MYISPLTTNVASGSSVSCTRMICLKLNVSYAFFITSSFAVNFLMISSAGIGGALIGAVTSTLWLSYFGGGVIGPATCAFATTAQTAAVAIKHITRGTSLMFRALFMIPSISNLDAPQPRKVFDPTPSLRPQLIRLPILHHRLDHFALTDLLIEHFPRKRRQLGVARKSQCD